MSRLARGATASGGYGLDIFLSLGDLASMGIKA